LSGLVDTLTSLNPPFAVSKEEEKHIGLYFKLAWRASKPQRKHGVNQGHQLDKQSQISFGSQQSLG
jgi:hypothetical protein